jgi:hypothetical protein
MAEFAYLLVPTSLKKFMQHIKPAGIPAKLTHIYLEGAGFKSTNDRAIIGVMKFIGFVDSSGVPTEKWTAYRSTAQGPVVLAAAIRDAYADLFNTYPDAYRRDVEALRNYFSTHTKVGDKALSAIVNTFKALCELANFDATPPAERNNVPPKVVETILQNQPPSSAAMTINLNIQLSLPATDDASIYDKIFEAMRKHLLTPSS